MLIGKFDFGPTQKKKLGERKKRKRTTREIHLHIGLHSGRKRAFLILDKHTLAMLTFFSKNN